MLVINGAQFFHLLSSLYLSNLQRNFFSKLSCYLQNPTPACRKR